MKVYINGCSTCGVNAAYIRKVKRWCDSNAYPLTVVNTKYDDEERVNHLTYSKLLGAHGYIPLIVHNDNITRLREWNY